MRSLDSCGKGKSPKWTESHVPKAGSSIEQIGDCHIGNYMEGYLTQERILFLRQQRALVVAFLLF